MQIQIICDRHCSIISANRYIGRALFETLYSCSSCERSGFACLDDFFPSLAGLGEGTRRDSFSTDAYQKTYADTDLSAGCQYWQIKSVNQ